MRYLFLIITFWPLLALSQGAVLIETGHKPVSQDSRRADQAEKKTPETVSQETERSRLGEIPAVPEEPHEIEGFRKSADFISRYKPNYFISGEPDTKIQFSFKYQLLRKAELYFGYKQMIFWELFERSRPIMEVNYNPEFFYRWSFDDSPPDFPLEYVQFGFWGHESNGRENSESRSWNKSYIQLNTKSRLEDYLFEWSGQLYTLYSFDPGNRDVQRYLGFGEMTFAISNFSGSFVDESQIYLRIFTGQGFDKGGRELGARFRLFWGELTPLFFMQLYDGYGESQIKYNVNEQTFRAGFSF